MLIDGLDAQASLRHLEGLRQAVEAMEIDIDGRPLRMTISIGASRRSPQFPNLHRLLGEADRQLYLAKAGGRNRAICIHAGAEAPPPGETLMAAAAAGRVQLQTVSGP